MEPVPTTASNAISRATAILRNGGVIVMPTDTIYGVGCDAFSAAGIERLYQIKHRDLGKSIPILIGDARQLALVASELPEAARLLAAAFWPGALTLILPRHASLPASISSDDTIGVRYPDHPFAAGLLRSFGPMAVTSANLSGQPNTTTAGEALQQLGEQIDLLLDGGQTPGATASTVVDCVSSQPRMLREGLIPAAAIEAALAAVGISLQQR